MKENSNDQLVKVITESGIDTKTAKNLQDSFLPFFNQAQEWADKAALLVVTDANQVQLMKDARQARLMLKEIRVNADKMRKTLKEDSLRYGKAVQGVYNVIEYLIAPIEQHLEKQEKFVEIQEAERKAKLKLQREDELRVYAQYVPFGIDLANMTDEDYQKVFSGAKLQFEAAIEAKERAEKERTEREAAIKLHNERKNTIILFWSFLTDSQKALDFSTISENEFSMILENSKSQKADYDRKQIEIKAENERLKAEKERKEKRNSELNPYITFIRDYDAILNLNDADYEKEFLSIVEEAKQHLAEVGRQMEIRMNLAISFLKEVGFKLVEHGYSAIRYQHFIGENHYNQLESDRELEEFKSSVLKTRELELQKIKNAKLEKELQAKKDAEAKALAEKERAERAEKAAQRKLAKAPDKDKMQLAIDSLTLSFDVKDEESKITSQKIVAQFESFKSWAKSEIEKL